MRAFPRPRIYSTKLRVLDGRSLGQLSSGLLSLMIPFTRSVLLGIRVLSSLRCPYCLVLVWKFCAFRVILTYGWLFWFAVDLFCFVYRFIIIIITQHDLE